MILRNLKMVTGKKVDIEIRDGVIARVCEAGQAVPLEPASSEREQGGLKPVEMPSSKFRDCSGMYVSCGWIDMHVHAMQELEPYGDRIDDIGVKQGVTTIVDAGSCGADRISLLAEHSRYALTRVHAFMNVSRIGLEQSDELSDLTWINREAAVEAAREHRGFVVGLKARISRSVVKDKGLMPLRLARDLAEETGLALMVHIGSGPPDIKEIMPLLRERDIVTHYLNGKSNNLFDELGRPLRVLKDAVERGVHLDVGHGTASFSFKAAEAAKLHGIRPDTISTDIYRGNRLHGPVYSLAHVMTKFLSLGYPLNEVIDGVTVRAAEWLGRPELGRIQVGEPACLTLFALKEKEVELYDSEGERRSTGIIIEPKGVVIDEQFISCE